MPLHWAIIGKEDTSLEAVTEEKEDTSLEIVKLLLPYADKFDINSRDEHGVNALMDAVRLGRVEIVKLLLQHGADGTMTSDIRDNGGTALHIAAREGHLEVVKALLQSKPELKDRVDRNGVTALELANEQGNEEVANFLKL